jgi:hypothetical protein
MFHTWGSLASPSIASQSNQFAAMPSLHVAWALWAGISVFRCARTRIMRCTALTYPALTFLVVVGTANHYIIDAIAGGATVAVAFAFQWLLSGHGAYAPPFDAPDFGQPHPPLPLRHADHALAPRPGSAAGRPTRPAEHPGAAPQSLPEEHLLHVDTAAARER